MKKIILASASPRRKELLRALELPFEIEAADIPEDIDVSKEPGEIVKELALKKAKFVAKKNPGAIVIGADTIVYHDGMVLGKPESIEAAALMLTTLSGQIHHVYTGVAIVQREKEEVFVEQTNVEFWPLTEDEIKAYLKTDEAYDKAGSYGIQGLGKLFVKRIEGDYYAVVGLPIARLKRVLGKFL